MLKYFIAIVILATAFSCKNSTEESPESIIGTWSVTDYQLEYRLPLSEKQKAELQESVKRQAQKLKEFAEFQFNEDFTYVQKFSPVDSDNGKWEIIQDSLLIYHSEKYSSNDTSVIKFSGKDEASIHMSDVSQSAIVYIKRK